MRKFVTVLMVGLCVWTAQVAIAQEDETDDFEGRWSFSGGGSFGSGGFGLRLSVRYLFNPYLGTDVSGSYMQASTEDKEAIHYRPEAALVLRVPNVTMFTPYGGAGLGWEFWERSQNNVEFDDSSSPVGVYFVGLGVGLSSNVSLNIQQTWNVYLADSPRAFGDHSKRESSSSSDFGFGIGISL